MKYTSTILLLLTAIVQLRAQAPFERDFNTLREQRDKAAAAAMDPINRRYQAGLEQLFRRATQGSDLDTALKAKAELQALATASAPTAAKATPAATPAVTVAPQTSTPTKVRSSNLVLSPEAMTWDQAVQWCVANRVQMLSYANWAEEKNREKINDEIGKHGVWIGLTFDFERRVWLDVDGSVVAKPRFNPSMNPPGSSAKGVGVHALFTRGQSIIYDVKGDNKHHVLATKIP